MKEYRKIGNITFEFVGEIDPPTTFKRATLMDCYVKPSERKRAIWRAWEDWARYSFNGAEVHMNVATYNCNVFTIDIYVGNYYLHITPTHNYAYKVR